MKRIKQIVFLVHAHNAIYVEMEYKTAFCRRLVRQVLKNTVHRTNLFKCLVSRKH